MSDEIYHGITYPEPGAIVDGRRPRGVCAWELGDEFAQETIVVSSFSKYWGMTGWRLGWMLLPEELVSAVDALAGNVALCPPAPSQLAAVEAFSDASYAEADAWVAQYAETRSALLAGLGPLGWGPAAPADGAFYLYAELGDQLRRFADSRAYCRELLEAEGVALVPGTDFDGHSGGRSVRLSFAAGPAAVSTAVERILRFQRA